MENKFGNYNRKIVKVYIDADFEIVSQCVILDLSSWHTLNVKLIHLCVIAYSPVEAAK